MFMFIVFIQKLFCSLEFFKSWKSLKIGHFYENLF